MSLAKRVISSTVWNTAAGWISWGVLFGRGVLLARWLPVDVFGTYALASSVVGLSALVAHLGMSYAFLHRAKEVENEELATAVFFTLGLVSALTMVTVLGLSTFVFASGSLRTALFLLTGTSSVSMLTNVPVQVLARRVVYRRLALLKLAHSVLATPISLALAWKGVTLWALLSYDMTNVLLAVLVLYVWRPVWRPRLAWSPQVVRYLLRFGGRSFLVGLLYKALDRIDDLWVGIYLGQTALGFYSKAYSFATYPRRVVAEPVAAVAAGTYAELKGNRQQLSQAFFRTTALLVRCGFLIGGGLTLIAPEFIRLVLGEKWLPMLNPFRLMLVFTLLDPLKLTIGDVFIAVGKPERLISIHLMQLVVMVVGLYALGPVLDIVGVALAMDSMLVLGIGLLLWQLRKYVDFSARELFLVPFLALAAGMILASSVLLVPGMLGADWRTGGAKLAIFVFVYVGMSAVLERRQIRVMIAALARQSPLQSRRQELGDR